MATRQRTVGLVETQRVNATVSQDEYDSLVRMADEQERSVSWLVRDAIRHYLQRGAGGRTAAR